MTTSVTMDELIRKQQAREELIRQAIARDGIVIDRDPERSVGNWHLVTGFHWEPDLPLGPMLVETEMLTGGRYSDEMGEGVAIGAWSAARLGDAAVIAFRQVVDDWEER